MTEQRPDSSTSDTRYPYTEACDFMRTLTQEASLSRSEASQIRQFFSALLGIDDHDLACKIADYAKANPPDTEQLVIKNLTRLGLLPENLFPSAYKKLDT